jgi:D-sedoheptulose 7-phosphate isomerase
MLMPADISRRLAGSLAAIECLRDQIATIERIGTLVVEALRNRRTIFTAGNGGSAAEALHLAEELIGRYRSNRAPARAVCLNADPTALTCIANDFGFEEVFARQIRALGEAGDVVIAFSTSGRSANVVRLLEAAAEAKCVRIGLLGGDGGSCRALCDVALVVPCTDSAHVQEAHQVVMHLICECWETAAAVIA